MFAVLFDEAVSQIVADLQVPELQVTELQQVSVNEMTISEGIELLNIILGNNNSQTIIEEVTNILTNTYLSSNVQAKIALRYVPLNNSRIQMLIEIMEQEHPEEERKQPIDKNVAATINNLVRLVVD